MSIATDDTRDASEKKYFSLSVKCADNSEATKSARLGLEFQAAGSDLMRLASLSLRFRCAIFRS